MKHRSDSKPAVAAGSGSAEDRLRRRTRPDGGPDARRGQTDGGGPARKWVFRLLALAVVPLLLLGLAEGGLRLAGYGYPTKFFKRARIQERDVIVENDKFGLRFFAPELARTPPPVVMPAKKNPGTYRIFLLGESAALGDPRPAYGMGRYLEVLLRERFPSTEFEIVCVAMTAINSHAILPLVRECAAHQSDLWVLYMGNNEMVGPFGAATVFGRQVPGLYSIRLTLALKSTRLGQWVDSCLRKWGAKPGGPWSGMSMFADQQVAADDPRRAIAYRHFANNLEDILSVAAKAACPVVLSTVASNLRDCAPFASTHNPTLASAAQAEFVALCQAAATNESTGAWAEALAHYRRAKELDATFAELSYRLGQCHLRQANLAEAKTAFTQARDLDALPFRADSKVNQLIREAAQRHQGHGVRLLDSDLALERQTTNGLPGAELFFEHVHFNFAGNYRLGRLLAEAIEAQLPPSISQQRASDWASPETCDRRLGLTDWNRVGVLEDVLRRLQAAPFTRQFDHQAQIEFWRTELRTLRARLTRERVPEAQSTYREALLRSPRDHRLYEGYAEFLEATGRTEEAALQWQSVCGLLPHHFAAYVHAGRLLGQQKQWSPAETSLRTALALEPRSGEGHLELGRVLAGQGKLEPAIAQYHEAIRRQPGNASIYLHLANALAQQEQRASAMEALGKAVQIQPSFWEARYLLGVELAMSNRIPEARKEFEEVLRWRPDHVLAHFNLGVVLVKQGSVKEAQAQFEAALRLDPQNERARQSLATLERMLRTQNTPGP